jgi:transposase-like protein
MATRRNLERWQSWRDVIRRQEESGLSVAAFCREEQVPPASFFAWRKKLAEADQDENASRQAQVQFVPIELSPCTPSASNFEIVGPTGYRVLVPAQFEAESLREILCVLQEVASC